MISLYTICRLTRKEGGKNFSRPADIVADPHFEARNMLPTLELPGSSRRVTVSGVPAKLTRTPGSVRQRAPTLGEHSEEVLKEAGLDDERIAKLQSSTLTGRHE